MKQIGCALHLPHKGTNLTIRIGSLFTGVSGLELELLKDSRFSLQFVADPEKYCAAVLAYNHPDVPNLGSVIDINATEIPDIDLLAGGTSCQGFSEQGLRAGLKHGKSKLFYEFARIINTKRPKHVLWENVRGSSTHKDFEIIKKIFKEMNYEIDWGIFNAREYCETIQQRKRVILLATRKECDQTFLDRTISNIELSSEMQDIEKRLVGVSKSHREEHIDIRLNNGTANTLVTGWGCSGMSTSNYILENGILRDLTVNECELLMTWEKNWTKWGIINGEKIAIPERQRYKICGNGVVSAMIPPLLRNLK